MKCLLIETHYKRIARVLQLWFGFVDWDTTRFLHGIMSKESWFQSWIEIVRVFLFSSFFFSSVQKLWVDTRGWWGGDHLLEYLGGKIIKVIIGAIISKRWNTEDMVLENYQNYSNTKGWCLLSIIQKPCESMKASCCKRWWQIGNCLTCCCASWNGVFAQSLGIIYSLWRFPGSRRSAFPVISSDRIR